MQHLPDYPVERISATVIDNNLFIKHAIDSFASGLTYNGNTQATTAEIVIRSEEFTPDTLENGVPKVGLKIRVVDLDRPTEDGGGSMARRVRPVPDFGDHVYTVLSSKRVDEFNFELHCAIDSPLTIPGS